MSDNAKAKLTIEGKAVENAALAGVTIDQDVDKPDMCTAIVKNVGGEDWFKKAQIGDSVKFEIAKPLGDNAAKTIFDGQIVGLEPHYEADGSNVLIIRAFHRLHQLTRGKSTETFEKMKGPDIVKKILGNYHLTPVIDGEVKFDFEHLYQPNFTDFEFALFVGNRIGFELICVTKDGKKDQKSVLFRQRKIALGKDPKKLSLAKTSDDAENPMPKLVLRMSTANQVKQVIVKFSQGGDRDKAESAKPPKMGKKYGYEVAAKLEQQSELSMAFAAKEKAEAQAFADAEHERLSLNFITGEATCVGNPDLYGGLLVQIALDAEEGHDSRFEGNYYAVGASHRYASASDGKGGYHTILKLQRNADNSGS